MIMYKSAMTEDLVEAEELHANDGNAGCGWCCVM